MSPKNIPSVKHVYANAFEGGEWGLEVRITKK